MPTTVIDRFEQGIAADVASLFAFYGPRANDTQLLKLTFATGGTYTLTFGGQTTSAIAFDADAATIQAALQALSSINANNVIVGGADGTFTIQFINSLGSAAQALITANTGSLTWSGSSAITVVQNSIADQTITIHNADGGSYGLTATFYPPPGADTNYWFPFQAVLENIPFNADAAYLTAAFDAVYDMGIGNVAITQQASDNSDRVFRVHFQGILAGLTIVPIVGDDTNLLSPLVAGIRISHIRLGSATGIAGLAQTGTFHEFASPAVQKEYFFGNDQWRTLTATYTPRETGLANETASLIFQYFDVGFCSDQGSLVRTATETGSFADLAKHGYIVQDYGAFSENKALGFARGDFGVATEHGTVISVVPGRDTSPTSVGTVRLVAAYATTTTGSGSQTNTIRGIISATQTGTGTTATGRDAIHRDFGTGSEIGSLDTTISGSDSRLSVESPTPRIVLAATQAGSGTQTATQSLMTMFAHETGTASYEHSVPISRIVIGRIDGYNPNNFIGNVYFSVWNGQPYWVTLQQGLYPGETARESVVAALTPRIIGLEVGVGSITGSTRRTISATDSGTISATAALGRVTISKIEPGNATETATMVFPHYESDYGLFLEGVWLASAFAPTDTTHATETVLTTPGRTGFLENQRPSVPIRR